MLSTSANNSAVDTGGAAKTHWVCTGCSYDLYGSVDEQGAGTCPECGREFAPGELKAWVAVNLPNDKEIGGAWLIPLPFCFLAGLVPVIGIAALPLILFVGVIYSAANGWNTANVFALRSVQKNGREIRGAIWLLIALAFTAWQFTFLLGSWFAGLVCSLWLFRYPF